MADFNGLSDVQKGAIVRYLLGDITGRRTGGAINFTGNNAVDEEGRVNVNANIPSTANLNQLRTVLNQNGFLDSLLGTVRSAISNERISALLADVGNLRPASEPLRQLQVSRDTGFAQQQYQREKVESAILKPSEYIKQKNIDLNRIDNDALGIYNTSFNKYLRDYRMPTEKAKNKAMNDARSYKQILMKQHNQEFPAELLKQAKSRIQQNVN